MISKTKKTILTILIVVSGYFLTPSLVDAASSTLYIKPDSGKAIQNCNFTADIMLDTQGNTADASQIYIDHNLTDSGDSFSLSGANLFNSYSKIKSLPKGIEDGIIGYGNDVKGSKLKVANVKFSSSKTKTADVKIYFDKNKSETSKVAIDGDNILTSVKNGSYSVESGFCEKIAPKITNLDPKNREPNHPVDQPIKFDITDNDSGVNITSLNVSIAHEGSTSSYKANDSEITYSKINKTDYSVEISPKQSFTPQKKVDVTIDVKDKAGNKNKRKYSFNDLTCKELGCSGSKINSQCNDGKDNDNDGKIDMNDSSCSSKTDNNEYTHSTHQCNDGKDNDGDGNVDLNDSACRTEKFNKVQTVTKTVTNTVYKTVTSTITNTTTGEPQVVTRTIREVVTSTVVEVEEKNTTTTVDKIDCNDGKDNDGDGLIDFGEDPGCKNKQDDSEFNKSSQINLSIDDLKFFIGDGTINAKVEPGRIIKVLSGSNFKVLFGLENINKTISDIKLQLEENQYNMQYNNSLEKYEAQFPINRKEGMYSAFVQITYNDGKFESIPFNISVQPSGKVVGRKENSDKMVGIKNADLTIERLENGKYKKFRDFITNKGGTYNLFVPNGTYRLSVSKEGYNTLTTAGFRIDNNILNKKVRLVRKVNLFDSGVSTKEKVRYVKGLATNRFEKTRNLADDPTVEESTEQNIAPVAAAVTGAVVAPALGFLNLLNYLKFLFLQPLLLFGRKKREEWGVVYDSLRRKPLDLAVVRLIDFNTDKVIRSQVTGKNGRFVFFVDPGKYRLKVEKDGYEFPSSSLRKVNEDGPYTDIYHGEVVEVEEENTGITPNIPIDPQEADEKTPSRIKKEKIMKKLQKYLAVIGLLAGIASMLINPTWLVGGLLVFQVVFYALFKRLGQTPEPDDWGIVRESNTKEGLKNVIVRLFTQEDNKLISTELTDSKGRYAFLVGPNNYYIRYDKEGYEGYGKEISIEEEGVIEETIDLEKKEGEASDNSPEDDDLSFAE